jgi:GDP/UDP-N,N'-diacetylbacillosamine 2-epimerase (hydrolysing)
MRDIKQDAQLTLQIIVTGMHLSPEFGLTYRIIEDDGFFINRKIEMVMSSDSPAGISKSIGLGLIGFADAYDELKPDLVLVLGDRYEIFSACCAAVVARLPIAHLHGGETTEGAIDEVFRHSITKMSHLHFVAADEYRQRVIQLGEQPERVFTVGGLGLDSIAAQTLLSREVLESKLDFKFGAKSLLITFHPTTFEQETAEIQMLELCGALAELTDTQLIFTLPNSDTDGRGIIKIIKEFAMHNLNAHVFTSLGQQIYLSCMVQVDAVVGNSSSGLLEAPSFKKAAINIGDRQRGRLMATSVVNCLPERRSISAALALVYSNEFNNRLRDTVNPYGSPGASLKITEIIKQYNLHDILKKKFYDLPSGTLTR